MHCVPLFEKDPLHRGVTHMVYFAGDDDVQQMVNALVQSIDDFRTETGASVREAFKRFVPGEVAPLEPGTRALVKRLAGQRFAERRKSHSTTRRVSGCIDHPSAGRISEVLIEQLVSHPDYQHFHNVENDE